MTTGLHTAAEVAEKFRTTKRWVQDLARSGEVAYTQGSRRAVLFTDEQLDALLAHRTRNPQNTTPSGIAATGRRTARRTA